MRKQIMILSITLLLLCSCGATDSISVEQNQSASVISEDYSENTTASSIMEQATEDIVPAAEIEMSEWDRIWRETRDWPLKRDDKDWDSISYTDKIAILNAPEDLLDTFTPEELTKLFLTNPLFPYMPSFTDYDKDLFFGIYEDQFNIAAKFMSMDDRFIYLMEAYRNNELNVEVLGKGEQLWDPSAITENMIIDYIIAFGADLSSEEKALYMEIFKERNEKYYSKVEGVTAELNMYEVVFDKALPHRKGFAR